MTPKNMSHLVRYRDVIADKRLQFLVLAGLSLGVVALTTLAYSSDPLLFQKFLGEFNPLIAIVVIALLGAVLLYTLLSRGWFAVFRPENPGRFLLPSGLVALLGAIIILVDLKVVFPEDLNVPFPQSLMYYPVMGYAAEIVFHVLPLSILLISLTSLSEAVDYSAIIWPCILVVSLLEPVFQTMSFVGHYPSWAVAYVALHVWAINVIELVLFERYDFISMYAFRLVYYLMWHIVWGYVRTSILF